MTAAGDEQITTLRMSVPDDIGHAVAYLASGTTGSIDGEATNVDGKGPRGGFDVEAVRIGAYGPAAPPPPADLILPK